MIAAFQLSQRSLPITGDHVETISIFELGHFTLSLCTQRRRNVPECKTLARVMVVIISTFFWIDNVHVADTVVAA